MRRALASSAAALVARRRRGSLADSPLSIAAAFALPSSPSSSLSPSLLTALSCSSLPFDDKKRFSAEPTARFGASSKAKAAAAAAAAAKAAANASSSNSSSEEQHGFGPAADDPPEGSQASDTNVYLHEVRFRQKKVENKEDERL